MPVKLLEFLSKCDVGSSGSFVKQGTYGIGLTYEIHADVTSPLSFVPLSSLLTQTTMKNKSVFIKFVPLTEPPPQGEYDAEIQKFPDINEIRYEDCEGDIVSDELDSCPREWDVIHTIEDKIFYDKFRGINWTIIGKEHENPIESTYIKLFLYECEKQIQTFKKTNHNLDSFVLPIYETLVIEQDNLHIIEELQKYYNFTDSNNVLVPDFFTNIKHYITSSKYFKMGIIVMPMMPIPPVTTGWNRFNSLQCIKDDNTIDLQHVSEKRGNDYYIYDYNNTNITWWARQSLFLFTQIIYYMITLLGKNIIHGDVHPGNVLIHPDLPNTIECFKDGRPNKLERKWLYSKLFLIDFGTVKNISVLHNSCKDIQQFREKIKLLLVTRGSHGVSPLESESNIYDWLPAFFLKRDSSGRYLLKKDFMYYIDYGKITRADHNKYFIDENMVTMFRMMQNFKWGNGQYINHTLDIIQPKDEFKDFLSKMRAFNKSIGINTSFPSQYIGGNKINLSNELKISMNNMIENLHHGETTLKSLQKKIKMNKLKIENKKSKSKKKTIHMFDKKHMNNMIENLYHGDETVKLLQKEYNDTSKCETSVKSKKKSNNSKSYTKSNKSKSKLKSRTRGRKTLRV